MIDCAAGIEGRPNGGAGALGPGAGIIAGGATRRADGGAGGAEGATRGAEGGTGGSDDDDGALGRIDEPLTIANGNGVRDGASGVCIGSVDVRATRGGEGDRPREARGGAGRLPTVPGAPSGATVPIQKFK